MVGMASIPASNQLQSPLSKEKYREGQRKYSVVSVFLGTGSQETLVFFTVL